MGQSDESGRETEMRDAFLSGAGPAGSRSALDGRAAASTGEGGNHLDLPPHGDSNHADHDDQGHMDADHDDYFQDDIHIDAPGPHHDHYDHDDSDS